MHARFLVGALHSNVPGIFVAHLTGVAWKCSQILGSGYRPCVGPLFCSGSSGSPSS